MEHPCERAAAVQENGLAVAARRTAAVMRAAAGVPASRNDIPALQRLAGNQAVGRLVAQAVQRGKGDVTIEDVEDEPPIRNEPPGEIEQPHPPLMLTDRPWKDIERERDQERDPRYQQRLAEMYRPKTDPKRLETLPPEVEKRVGAQYEALVEHDEALKAETGAVHGRSRHGWQTGWEGQKRRAENKLTPEQPTDPMGTGMSITEWMTTKGTNKPPPRARIQAPTSTRSIEEGVPVFKEDYERQRLLEQHEVDVFNQQQLGQPTKSGRPAKQKTLKAASKPSKSGGPYAGSFFSPEHQNRLVARALELARGFDKWTEARFTKAGWKPIAFLDVVLQEERGGYGVAFSRGKGSETAYVLKIKDSPLAGGDETMDVYLMLCAKVQLKRQKDLSWQVLSSFPENLEPGLSPIHDHGKDAWTGEVRSRSETGTLKAPDWAPEGDDT
jgi:hypothetical protein